MIEESMVEDSKERAKLLQETTKEMQHLDFLIEQYIQETILPMVLPLNASPEETENVQRMLKAVVSLDVYHQELKKLYKIYLKQYDAYRHIYPEDKLKNLNEEMEYLLIKTHPEKQAITNKIKLSPTSRYTGIFQDKQQNETNIKKRIRNRRLENSVKELEDELTPEELEDLLKKYPQAQRILELREIFHNNGTIDLGILTQAYLEKVETIVSKLRYGLESKNYRYKLFSKKTLNRKRKKHYFKEEEMAEYNKLYASGCAKAQFIFGLLGYYTRAQNKQVYRDEQAEERERKRNRKLIVKLFSTMFCNLPTDISKHPKVLEKQIQDIKDIMEDKNKLRRTEFSEYVPQIQKQYEKMMEQLQNGELDDKYSYEPEAKKRQQNLEEKERKDRILIFSGVAVAATILLLAAPGCAEEITSPENENLSKDTKKIAEKQNQNVEKSPIIDSFETNQVLSLTNELIASGVAEDVRERLHLHAMAEKRIIQDYENSSTQPKRRRRRPSQNRLVDIVEETALIQESPFEKQEPEGQEKNEQAQKSLVDELRAEHVPQRRRRKNQDLGER